EFSCRAAVPTFMLSEVRFADIKPIGGFTMKRVIVVVLVSCVLVLGSGAARAAEHEPEYEDSFMHPLRLASYFIHPIGFVAEWLIGRPLHYVVSRPDLARVFGYQSTEEKGSFRRY